MRIALDLRPTQINYIGHGIGNYTEDLVHALHETDSNNTYCLLYHPTYKIKFIKELKDNFAFFPLPMPVKKPFKGYYLYFDQFVLPRFLKEIAIDVYHSPDFNPPYFKPCKTVATIHDLALLKFPYLTGHSRLDNLVYKWKLFNAKRADAIITDSQYSKQDILELLKAKDEQVSVIYPSYNTLKMSDNSDLPISSLDKMGIAIPYILYVGGLNNRLKNLEFLIEAFAPISKKYEQLKLVICGENKGRYFDKMYQYYTDLVSNYGINERVIFTGYVPADNLNALYRYAQLMVFPSKHEGFGLPVIEAMSLDCPVLASNATALPETVGEGGLLFNPDNLTELIEKIQQILDNKQLRDKLINKGKQRVKQLSWKKAAEQTIALYRKVGGTK